MSAVDIILQERHLDELRTLVLRPDRIEAAAYVLWGEADIGLDPWNQRSRRRLLSFKVLPVPIEDQISAGPMHVTWSTASFVRLLKQAQEQNLVAGIVHAHPGGPAGFSEQDTRNEAELAKLARNRNGESGRVCSLLLTGNGELRGRLWLSPTSTAECSSISVVGRRLIIHGTKVEGEVIPEILARQTLLFGPEATAQLRRLKVAVVGAGGTGSATAMLLARLGVGHLVIVDDDIVETTNLNRLHGATQADADAKHTKVDVVARAINELGLGVRAIPLRHWVGHQDCRDAMRSCDVIFGCTDDHDGRMFLNRFAYFYLIPGIDMGLAIQPREAGGFSEMSGRVTVLAPGAPCLLCRGIVDPVSARDEDLKRRRPEEYERRKQEAYVRGGGNPAPAVVTFTTETATMAVNELLQGLTAYRGGDGWCWNRTRRFDQLKDRQPGADRDPECPICSDMGYWGRGDLDPFLDRTG